MDNSANRLHNVFFYGLYMDPEVLQSKQVLARNPRLALLPNYRLRIGKMATLLRDPGKYSIGMLYSLTHADLNALYWGVGLTAYAAEAVLVNELSRDAARYHRLADLLPRQQTLTLATLPALCCVLIEPPGDDESNQPYQEKLLSAMQKLEVAIPDEIL